jgi:hypothetical protein
VPAHWHDTIDYQKTKQLADRGVTLWDRKLLRSIDNMPFRHIEKLALQDAMTLGGLKKAIRLAKSIKADAQDEGKVIDISSFDIASAVYYADSSALCVGYNFELAILAELQRHLDRLATSFEYARSLTTPDGTRKIFDSDAKLAGVRALSIEVDVLTEAVAREQWRSLRPLSNRDWHQIGAVLGNTRVN